VARRSPCERVFYITAVGIKSPHGQGYTRRAKTRASSVRFSIGKIYEVDGVFSPACTATSSRLGAGASGHTQRGSYAHDGL
jgi:hypothetical protein